MGFIYYAKLWKTVRSAQSWFTGGVWSWKKSYGLSALHRNLIFRPAHCIQRRQRVWEMPAVISGDTIWCRYYPVRSTTLTKIFCVRFLPPWWSVIEVESGDTLGRFLVRGRIMADQSGKLLWKVWITSAIFGWGASYGVNGTMPTDNYGWRSLTSYASKYMGQAGGGINAIGNENLTWETSYTSNLALEFGFVQ